MRVLVAGGAGFIGSNYVRRLVDGTLGGVNQITVLDKLTYAGSLSNLSSALETNSLTFIRGDICDYEQVMKVIRGHDCVINFAAESHVDRSIADPLGFFMTNVIGTERLLQASLDAGIKTFVQVSTDEVYGSIPKGSWTEDSPILPNSPYSASKASADLVARAFYKTYNLDVRITRCSNNYGPFQFPEKIIPYFITSLLQNKKIPVYGTGKNVRDWLHVDDHCRAIHLVLTKGKPGEIYNIGGGKELTNLELTEIILKQLNKDLREMEFVKDRPGHDFRYSIDYTKIKTELGYHPRIDFVSGIRATIDWYQANEKWLAQIAEARESKNVST